MASLVYERENCAAATHTGKFKQIEYISTSQSVVLWLESFSNSIFYMKAIFFSDLFPLFNMLATAITSEPSRKLENEYGTKRITKQTTMR